MPPPGVAARFKQAVALTPGWPLRYLLVGFPLWWVLGLNTFIFPILAVPMLVDLRRRRPLRYPPAFALWALYLVWQVVSLAMFNASPPGTHAGSATGRLISIGFDAMMYAAVTVVLLYVGNLPTELVSQRKITRWMGTFFLTVVAGGFLGVVVPYLSFPSLLELVLPRHVTANAYVSALVHPAASQIQSVLGQPGGRPSAPFGYTNTWGAMLSILLVWFVAGWILPARGFRKACYIAILIASLVPVVFSLDRGLWIGLILTAVWFTFRQLTLGRIGVLLAGVAVVIAGGAVFVSTPLYTVIGLRLQNPQSNDARAFLARVSVSAANHSPIIGYGGTRHTDGSPNSIAVGATAKCPSCGGLATGGTGTLWAVMFDQGYVGVVLYFGFFGVSIWIYRRDRSRSGEAALCTLGLVFVYMLFYSALPGALTLTMVSVGVLWRNRESLINTDPRRRVPLASDHPRRLISSV